MKFNALAFLLVAGIAGMATPANAARASNQQVSLATLRGSNKKATANGRHMKEVKDYKKGDSDEKGGKGKGEQDYEGETRTAVDEGEKEVDVETTASPTKAATDAPTVAATDSPTASPTAGATTLELTAKATNATDATTPETRTIDNENANDVKLETSTGAGTDDSDGDSASKSKDNSKRSGVDAGLEARTAGDEKKKEKDNGDDELETRAKEDKNKQVSAGGGDPEGESRLANCAARGNIATIAPKSVDNWMSLVMGGDLCSSDCECASGCCGWFWVRMCVNPSMQGMKCLGDAQQQIAQGEVPGTGGDDQGSDEGSQGALVVATPTGGADDIPSVNPPVPEETQEMTAMETPAKPEMKIPEGEPGSSTTESTPFYNDISTGPEEKKDDTPTMIYPVEYPEGHPNAPATPATPATGKQPEMPSLAGGSEAKPGRNSGANAAESKEGPGSSAGPAAKSGSGPKKGSSEKSKPGHAESKEGMVSGPGAKIPKGPGAKGPKAGPGAKGGPGSIKGGSGPAGPAGGAGATTGGAKGAKPSEAKQGGGEKQKKDNENDMQPSVAGGQTAEGVSRLPACAARGNVPTIEPKSVDNWTGLIMGGDRCNDNCECASGCCGWFWVRMCVNPSMQGMKCMADKAVSRTEDAGDEDTDLELSEPEVTNSTEVATANSTETVIEIIATEDEETAEAEAGDDVKAVEAIATVTVPTEDSAASASANKAGGSRSNIGTGTVDAKAADDEGGDETEGLENENSEGKDVGLIDNYDFSNGWPGWNDDKCQHSYQCQSGCCAWAHSNVCMDQRTWMGRFACIA